MVIDISVLQALFPRSVVLVSYLDPLNNNFDRYDMTTPNRIAMFLAQTGVESGGYVSTRITENLNYKVSALTALFPNRITAAQAAQYGRNDATGQKANQEAIANIIYGGSWGAKNLGNTQQGDGWKFRGRGIIQITGRGNYQKFADSCHRTIDQAVSYLETPEGAVAAAFWFWQNRQLNSYADAEDVIGCTKRVNGGTMGLQERTNLFNKALTLIQ